VAQAAPDLIRRIAAQGHEVAYHSHAHTSLTDQNPQEFEQECRDDKDRIEQLTGRSLKGFRAPRFSLTPQTQWVTDTLAVQGFLYSSSIMPTALSRFGFASASTKPFRWPSGLIELPLPVAHFGRYAIPYLGGIYLYGLPSFLAHHFVKSADSDELLWTYAHPYDFDRDESYIPMPRTPLWVALVLWAARRQAEKKILNLLANTYPAPTLEERAEDYAKEL
jgi:peptidoglycan/xylan/chitin deacetylase (PgdA/CDA1 family)